MTLSVRSREKIALVVFAGLIVLSLLGLGWYLLAGHSWNVAASNIDDTFGSMDGYTAIVYAGTVEPEPVGGDLPETTGDFASDAAGGSGEGGGSGAAGPGSGAVPGVDDAGAGASGSDSGAGASDPGASGSSAADLAAKTANAASVGAKRKAVTVADAKQSYEDKGATVFSLDTVHPEQYDEGTILKKGGHRFGVFSVSAPASIRAVKAQVAYFSDYQVDFIVAVTSDKAYVEGVEGIDIVLSTQDEELFVMGETRNGTFFVDAPVQDTVGVILISPSNVVSAKVIEEL